MMKFKKSTMMIFCLLLFIFNNAFSQTKISIAVIDLDYEGISKSGAKIISSRLRTELFNTQKFIVLERDKIDEILKEQGFQLSGCTTNECIVEIGKLIGVSQIVAGNIGKIGKLITISIRLVDVETGVMLRTATEDCECSIETVVTKSIKNVAQDLAGEEVQTYNYKETKEESKPIQTSVKHPNSKKKNNLYFIPKVGMGTYTGAIGAELKVKKIGFNFGIIPVDTWVILGIKYYFTPPHDSFFIGVGGGRRIKESTNDYKEYYYHFGPTVGYCLYLGSNFNISFSVGAAYDQTEKINLGSDYHLSKENSFFPMGELAIGYSF